MKLAEPNVHKSLLFVAILNFFAQKKLKKKRKKFIKAYYLLQV